MHANELCASCEGVSGQLVVGGLVVSLCVIVHAVERLVVSTERFEILSERTSQVDHDKFMVLADLPVMWLLYGHCVEYIVSGGS